MFVNQFFAKSIGIGEVSVMSKGNPERGIYKKRLRLEFAVATGGRITNMTDAHATLKMQKRFEVKYFTDKTVPFFEMKLAVIRDDPRRILTAVLQKNQAIIEIVNSIIRADDSEDAADRGILRILCG